ncbi:MAG: hypothetical protein WBX15_08120 [Thermoanaerobaculia bacterium]
MKRRILLIACCAFLSSMFLHAAAPTVPAGHHALTLPVVGDVEGGGGAHFRTDVTISNTREMPQMVRLEWLPRAGEAAPVTKTVTLDRYTIRVFRDFTTDVLQTTGLGSLRVTALLADGATLDEGSAIDGFARIYATVGDGEGTVSQSFSAVYDSQLVDPNSAVPNVVLMGLRQDADFRTNIGIVNLDSERRHQFYVVLHGSNGDDTFVVTVEPNSLAQVALPDGDFGDLTLNIVEHDSPGGYWTAYASTVDNRSADGWISQDAHRQFRGD